MTAVVVGIWMGLATELAVSPTSSGWLFPRSQLPRQHFRNTHQLKLLVIPKWSCRLSRISIIPKDFARECPDAGFSPAFPSTIIQYNCVPDGKLPTSVPTKQAQSAIWRVELFLDNITIVHKFVESIKVVLYNSIPRYDANSINESSDQQVLKARQPNTTNLTQNVVLPFCTALPVTLAA